ncbi:hypothetical protein D3C72_1818320 [compost metagenome]
MAAGVEHVAARQVQRQRQAEHLARLHFTHGLQHFFLGQQVQPAQFIVRAEVAPGGSFGALRPAFHLLVSYPFSMFL